MQTLSELYSKSLLRNFEEPDWMKFLEDINRILSGDIEEFFEKLVLREVPSGEELVEEYLRWWGKKKGKLWEGLLNIRKEVETGPHSTRIIIKIEVLSKESSLMRVDSLWVYTHREEVEEFMSDTNREYQDLLEKVRGITIIL